MSFVDFKISSIKKTETIPLDSDVEVSGYFNRGHYETIEGEQVYVRDERFEEAFLIFVPCEATEEDINKELYLLLLEEKKPSDEVIPECVHK